MLSSQGTKMSLTDQDRVSLCTIRRLAPILILPAPGRSHVVVSAMSPWFAAVHLRLLLYHTHDAHDILTLLRDILLGHHVALSRISVFHPDLSTIQRSLDLHNGLSLIQCRRLLLHDITTGACADHVMDASLSP